MSLFGCSMPRQLDPTLGTWNWTPENAAWLRQLCQGHKQTSPICMIVDTIIPDPNLQNKSIIIESVSLIYLSYLVIDYMRFYSFFWNIGNVVFSNLLADVHALKMINIICCTNRKSWYGTSIYQWSLLIHEKCCNYFWLSSVYKGLCKNFDDPQNIFSVIQENLKTLIEHHHHVSD